MEEKEKKIREYYLKLKKGNEGLVENLIGLYNHLHNVMGISEETNLLERIRYEVKGYTEENETTITIQQYKIPKYRGISLLDYQFKEKLWVINKIKELDRRGMKTLVYESLWHIINYDIQWRKIEPLYFHNGFEWLKYGEPLDGELKDIGLNRDNAVITKICDSVREYVISELEADYPSIKESNMKDYHKFNVGIIVVMSILILVFIAVIFFCTTKINMIIGGFGILFCGLLLFFVSQIMGKNDKYVADVMKGYFFNIGDTIKNLFKSN